jgi:hypothetical protein
MLTANSQRQCCHLEHDVAAAQASAQAVSPSNAARLSPRGPMPARAGHETHGEGEATALLPPVQAQEDDSASDADQDSDAGAPGSIAGGPNDSSHSPTTLQPVKSQLAGPGWLQTSLPQDVVGRFFDAMGVHSHLDAETEARLRSAAQEQGRLLFSDFFKLWVRGVDRAEVQQLRCVPYVYAGTAKCSSALCFVDC